MARGRGSGGEEAVDLWAMVAELERHFAGYKQRLAERGGTAARERDGDAAAAACDGTGGGGGVYGASQSDEAGGRGSNSSDVRGRMYEAYVRRRDERLREGWRARMERKEAEVKALWAQLELTGRAGAGAERAPGGDPTPTTTDGGAAAGDEVGNSVTCHTTPSCPFSVSRLFATTRCRLFLASFRSLPERVIFERFHLVPRRGKRCCHRASVCVWSWSSYDST